MNKKEKYRKQQEEKKIRLNGKYRELMDSIITDPEEIERFVKIATGGFHQYSFRNMVLAWIQCPNVSLMASYNDWVKRGRQVMRGQKALSLLAPNTYRKKVEREDGEIDEEFGVAGFRLINKTFDASQTGVPKVISIPTGRTFEVLDPLDRTGLDFGTELYINGPENLHFEDFVKDTNVKVNIKKTLGGASGQTGGQDIDVVEKENESAMITTLFHEEMHIDLGHLKKDCELSREVKEVTAEAGAYLVSTFFGIENNKAKYYIGNWGGNKELLKDRGAEVMRVAEKVIKRHLKTVIVAQHGVEPKGVESHA
jgi:hypothetical protein